MPRPVKIDLGTSGVTRRFSPADVLQIDNIQRFAGSGNMFIGSNLGAAEELVVGSATSVTRFLGDTIVDGSETISTNETITGVFSANGNVNLGNNDGDIINLGGGTSDIVNLDADLVLGAGIVTIGSGVADYALDLWLDAVNAAGPALAAYNLNASGTNAGAYAIGVDPALTTNSAATDLMSMLDDFDAAITASAGTLQATYETGNTIDVTSAEGIIEFANDTTADTTTVLSIARAPGSSTAGIGLDVNMGANTTGIGVNLLIAGTGDGIFLNNTGTGAALTVQDGGTDIFDLSGAGAVTLSPTSGQNTTITMAGAGILDITGDTQLVGTLRFTEEAGDPTAVANNGFVYTKDVSAETELFYRDSAGNVVQLTAGGSVNASSDLQSAYEGGNTIDVTSANGTITFTNDNDTDTTTVLSVAKSPDGSTAGLTLSVNAGGNVTGTMVLMNNEGSGAALIVQDTGSDVLNISGAGAVTWTPTSGQNYSLTTAGAGTISLASATGDITLDATAAELILDDVGSSATTLSQSGERVFDQAATGELFDTVTSLLGALNFIARQNEENSTPHSAQFPIENTVVIGAGNVVAASTVSGRVTLNDDNQETRSAVIGIAITGGTGDAGGTVLTRFVTPGNVATVTGATFTPGGAVFAPDGTGNPTQSLAGRVDDDRVTRIGYAITATTFMFIPTMGFTE